MVETLNLRGLENFSSEIQTFLQTLEKSFLHTLNTCVPADKQEKEALQLRDTVEGIGNCLEIGSAPGDQFECFSCGTFKEAYHASDSIVVKFCSVDNETIREQALLHAAKEADILELFVPTFFHQLPINLAVTQLDDTNSSRYIYNYHTWNRNPDVEDFELNYLEIQPIVIPASHVNCEMIPWNAQGEIIPGIMRRIPTSNLTWLRSIVEHYGKDFFEKFAIFCDDWHIWDLHDDNIGFLRTPEVELPIILDWMSD